MNSSIAFESASTYRNKLIFRIQFSDIQKDASAHDNFEIFNYLGLKRCSSIVHFERYFKFQFIETNNILHLNILIEKEKTFDASA